MEDHHEVDWDGFVLDGASGGMGTEASPEGRYEEGNEAVARDAHIPPGRRMEDEVTGLERSSKRQRTRAEGEDGVASAGEDLDAGSTTNGISSLARLVHDLCTLVEYGGVRTSVIDNVKRLAY